MSTTQLQTRRKSQRQIQRRARLALGLFSLLLVAALATGANNPARGSALQGTEAATESTSPGSIDPTQPDLVGINPDAPVDALSVISVGTGGAQPTQDCQNDLNSPDVQPPGDFAIDVSDLQFQIQQPAYCATKDLNPAKPYAVSPSGHTISLNSYSFTADDGSKLYAITLPLVAYVEPGAWHLKLKNPDTDLMQIDVPVASQPFFLRGRGDSHLVGGFKPNERVKGVAYADQGNGNQPKWVYSGTINFQAAANGYRLITVKNSHDVSFVLIGQQHSFIMANAWFRDNDANQDQQNALFTAYWSNNGGGTGGNSGGNTGGGTGPSVKTRTDSKGIEQVWVPAGCFQMGSPAPHDISPQIKDQTRRQVCLTNGYWIDRYEVSNAAYQQFIAAGGYQTRNFWTDAGWQWVQDNNRQGPEDFANMHLSDANQPRVGATLFEAEAYANWRGGKIPTEAEWEFAASGPQSRVYPWGNGYENGRANILGVAGRTVDVKSNPSGQSWVGAFNMSGNAGEWVSDCYNQAYDAGNVKNDPVGPCDGSSEMVKGSSWSFNQFPAQVTYRFVNPPLRDWFDVGIRVISR